MKLTPEVLAAAQSYINPLKDRELNLRGSSVLRPVSVLFRMSST